MTCACGFSESIGNFAESQAAPKFSVEAVGFDFQVIFLAVPYMNASSGIEFVVEDINCC